MELALREIARSKLRFSLLSLAVGLLVFLILFQQALFGGLVTSFIGAVENQNAPVLVYGDQARRNVEASLIFPGLDEQVAAVPGVASTGPIGENTFTVSAGDEKQDAALFGYELGGLGEPTSLVEGRLPNEAGEGVTSFSSENNGFEVGDTITILGEQPVDITVVGVAEDARWSVQATIFVSYDTYVQSKQALDPDAQVLPSLIAVQPEDGVDPGELATTITASLDGVEALTRQQAIDENPGVKGVNSSFNIILALAFMVVVLVVGFFFLILTVQKSKPLTLLRAIGAPRRYLVLNLLVQIVIVMLAGTIIGIVLTLLVGTATSGGAIDVSLDPAQVAPTVGILIVLAMVGGVASVRRVLRIDPIRATLDAGSSL